MCECVPYADDLLPLDGKGQLELEQWCPEYTRVVNSWSFKVGVAILMEESVAMLLDLKANCFVHH